MRTGLGGAWRSAWLLDLESVVDRRAARRARTDGVRRHHVLLATVGRNIGDQAMLESFVSNVSGSIHVVVPSHGAFVNPEPDRVRFEVAERLFAGNPVQRAAHRKRFVSLLREAASVSIIGADIIDGSYDRREACLRLNAVEMAAAAGVESRVLGFSWSGSADPYVTAKLRAIAPLTRLLVRDRVSHERLLKSGVDRVNLVADTVFALPGTTDVPEVRAWVERRRPEGRRVVVLNVSGLVTREAAVLEAHATLLDRIVATSDVILLPHVIRDGDSDLQACQLVLATLKPETASRVLLVPEMLSPRQVREVTRLADAVITGRMHLAILAISVGTPVGVIGTQGKVEGMLELFDITECLLDARDDLVARALGLLSAFQRSDEVRARIAERADGVVDLARGNFLGLEAIPAVTDS